MTKIWNFGAGPGTFAAPTCTLPLLVAVLPRPVLEQVQNELLDFNGTGMSIMELSHRSVEFETVLKHAVDDIRSLMKLPENYHVLFVQGGATNQFSAVLFNLLQDVHGDNDTVDYIVTGTWSEKAHQEAVRFLGDKRANCVMSTKSTKHTGLFPPKEQWKWSEKPSFVYYCDNETIHGVEMPAGQLPTEAYGAPYDHRQVPIICDMSSNFFSRPVPNIEKFAMIYGGAQKNIGPAGLTVLIVRDDMLRLHREKLHKHVIPVMMDYYICQQNSSLYNTPPTFAIYVCGLTLKWIKDCGGMNWIESLNKSKSDALYDYIESSGGFYKCPVVRQHASRMNVPIRIYANGTPSEALEKRRFHFGGNTSFLEFVKEAESEGLLQLAGHRSAGGLRASIYNAMELEGVEVLVTFMKRFFLKNQAAN